MTRNAEQRAPRAPGQSRLRVLIVLGHPRADSFSHALARAYRAGARRAGFEVQELELARLRFDPNVADQLLRARDAADVADRRDQPRGDRDVHPGDREQTPHRQIVDGGFCNRRGSTGAAAAL